MPPEPYVYKLILHYLEVNGPKSSKEIVEGTLVSYSSVSKVMPKLRREQRVKRKNGPGHSYIYEFLSYEPKSKGSNLVTPVNNPNHKPLDAEHLRNAILHWAQNGWSPKSSQAAQELLTILGKLHMIYWQALTRGLPVDQSDLDLLKTNLFVARDTAFNFAEFFDRLLATSDLWDHRRSAEYLLEGVEDPVSYVETARTVGESLRLTIDN